MRPIHLTFVVLWCCCVALAGGCEPRTRIGDLRPDAATFVPPPEPDASVTPLAFVRRSPHVPCTIYGMAESQADRLYLGCRGGLIYRWDGVRATLEHETREAHIFSLLFAPSDGVVWAGAQTAYDRTAPTQLYRKVRDTWEPVGDASERITSLSGVETRGDEVWTTTAREIRKWNGTTFTLAHRVTRGELRSCAFTSPTDGYCTGTEGLALRWDGAAWTELPSPPWSAQAEVIGVELERFRDPLFLYSEPLPSGGRVAVHAAQWVTGAFRRFNASVESSSDFDIARRRVAVVNVNLRNLALLSLDEQYGGGLVFDPVDDAFRPLCGPIRAFAVGSGRTRAGGSDGLLVTLQGKGGAQVGVEAVDRFLDFESVSMAADGTAWARVTDETVCGSGSDSVARWEGQRWAEVPSPDDALSGLSMSAVARDHAFTVNVFGENLMEIRNGEWRAHGGLTNGWSSWAASGDDVWVGGSSDELFRWRAGTMTPLLPKGRGRQVQEVRATGDIAWMVAKGYTRDDTDAHVYRYEAGVRREWNLGLSRERVTLSALDAEHAWHSGSPAKVWQGNDWQRLPFDASGVWARTPNEVYFTRGGDIFRWNGVERVRVYRGFIPIRHFAGRGDRAIAVGRGGLTIEFAAEPASGR